MHHSTQKAAALLAELDAKAFEHPWEASTFAEELQRTDVIALAIDRSATIFEIAGQDPVPDQNSNRLPSADSPKPVAYLIARVYLLDDTIDLMRIATLPELQRQGYGRLLMKELENRALPYLERPAYILLEVSEKNTAAIHLYGSEGYKIVHHRKNYYPDGAMALIMRKSLGGPSSLF